MDHFQDQPSARSAPPGGCIQPNQPKSAQILTFYIHLFRNTSHAFLPGQQSSQMVRFTRFVELSTRCSSSILKGLQTKSAMPASRPCSWTACMCVKPSAGSANCLIRRLPPLKVSCSWPVLMTSSGVSTLEVTHCRMLCPIPARNVCGALKAGMWQRGITDRCRKQGA